MWKPRSIAARMFLGGLATSSLVVLAAIATFLAYEVRSRQALATQTITSYATGLAYVTAPGLMFDDAESARRSLDGLLAVPTIRWGAVYDARGDLFAAYSATPGGGPPQTSAPVQGQADTLTERSGNMLYATRTIVVDDNPIGTLRLASMIPTPAALLGGLAPAAAATAAFALLVVGVIVQVIARQVTRPVRELTEAAASVTRNAQYDIRVHERGRDEIAGLAHSFNAMLEQIRVRDDMLERARATLETRVRERTSQLQEEIAERRRAQEEREQALRERQRIMDTVADVIYALDGQGRLVSFNRQMLQVTGRPAEELTGIDARALFVPEDRPTIEQAIRRVLTDGSAVASGRLMHTDGHSTWHAFTGQILRGTDGEILGLTGVGRDVEEQRRAEAEILRLNAELEQRVLERTAELEAANRELEAFSYSASHDLRTPLRAIDGFSRALIEDYGTTLDETARGYLDRVRAATARMAELIDDLLRLARITQHDMERRQVNLSEIALRVAARLAEAAPDRAVHFEAQPGLYAVGDAHLLEAVLENLLGNAWKFTAANPHPAVTFGRTEQSGGLAWFVRDNGVGFDMRHAGRLFRPFERLHSAREFPGTGIGLATVQRIVQRHGGRVWAEAREGVGTTIYFTLTGN